MFVNDFRKNRGKLYLAAPKRNAMQILRVVLMTAFIIFFLSCKNDDNLNIEVIPPRSLSEVEAEDRAEILEYLQTHFYNYEEFENPPADFDYAIVLDTIAGDNADKTPIIDRPELQTIVISVSSEDFDIDENETVDHTMYFLNAREGAGESPTTADSTLVKYEGSLLNGNLFDATSTYGWQYLPFFLRGYGRAISNFRSGDGFITNPDGTAEVTNAGVGLMFLPSGLGYFNNTVAGVPSYSPLIFKIELGLFIEDTDYDNDGIPSILEDLDGDGDVTNDNTDRKQEESAGSPAFPNHIDPDDDQDGTPTRDEIIIDDQGNITFPDGDNDGIPDYLDRDNS